MRCRSGCCRGRAVDEGGGLELEARLSDEPVPTLLKLPHDRETPESLVEMFWKTADLTGAHACPEPGDGTDGAGRWTRVRAVRMRPRGLCQAGSPRRLRNHEAVQSDSARQETRRLFAHQGRQRPAGTLASDHGARHPARDRALPRHRLLPALLGGRARRFDVFPHRGWDAKPPSTGWAISPAYSTACTWKAAACCASRDIDPFDVAADYAHEIGLEFHASYRVAGFRFPPPYDHFNWGNSVYVRHPGVARRQPGRRADAPPGLHLSRSARERGRAIARDVPNVRLTASVCSTVAARRWSSTNHHVVEAFQAADPVWIPRALDPLDPRWLHFRAEVLTQFMREVRQSVG